MDDKLIKCPGCGAKFSPSNMPPNRYGVASAGCWQALNEYLAYERTEWGYPEVHRLVIDAYSVQHPQNFELQAKLNIAHRFIDASVQSIAVHLIALHFALVEKRKLSEIAKLMNLVLQNGATFDPLKPPESLGKLTIADAPSTPSFEEYNDFAWKWAKEAWEAWSEYHGQVNSWIKQYT